MAGKTIAIDNEVRNFLDDIRHELTEKKLTNNASYSNAIRHIANKAGYDYMKVKD